MKNKQSALIESGLPFINSATGSGLTKNENKKTAGKPPSKNCIYLLSIQTIKDTVTEQQLLI